MHLSPPGEPSVDFCTALVKLLHVVKLLWGELQEFFLIIELPPGERTFCSACFCTAGKGKEVIARVNREVDEVLHQLCRFVALLPRAWIQALLLPGGLIWTEWEIEFRFSATWFDCPFYLTT